MLFTDIIQQKREGGALSTEQIDFFVAGLADNSLPAEQVSALAMAIVFNSMSADECAQLTMSMAASGAMLDWRDANLDGPVVDKHSTGGVGDKVSFMLAPIAAACGCYVPMISGRGLGHTGGTTDKVESIPGYQSMPDFDLFKKVVRETGCAIIGQTESLAPADRRFYAIRDVTATVESVPLITASILSKKIAAGLDALVMDVKVGNGAFMPTFERAEKLVRSIIATAARANLKTHALVTDMNECLGHSAGNALEITEAIQFLRNEEREERLNEVVLALCAQMLVVTGIESNRDKALARVDDAITSGRAAEIFARMVHALGGPSDLVESYQKYLPRAAISTPVYAAASGFVVDVDTHMLGNAVIELGGGRHSLGEKLDLSVGLADVVPRGTEVSNSRPIAIIHAATNEQAALAAEIVRDAYRIADSAPAANAVIHATFGEE